jgi:enamine deaminase RidA (YjgF/YER057c/UK114 family)
MKPIILTALAALALATTATAAPKARSEKAEPGNRFIGNPSAVIASGVVVPAGSELFFVSGIPGDPKAGDTQAQTADALTKLGAVLTAAGYSYADVVNAKVYLVGDPKLDGKLDFAGMNAAFKKVFGTAEEPNKPSRVTVQVAGLAAAGSLVEIELVAAKAPAK